LKSCLTASSCSCAGWANGFLPATPRWIRIAKENRRRVNTAIIRRPAGSTNGRTSIVRCSPLHLPVNEPFFSLAPSRAKAGGRILPTKCSRFEPLNPLTRPEATLSPTGGEGRVRGRSGGLRFMGRGATGTGLTTKYTKHTKKFRRFYSVFLSRSSNISRSKISNPGPTPPPAC